MLLLWAALVVVSVAAHGLAGGEPGPGMVVLLAAASAGPMTWLGWRSRPTWVVAPVLAMAQMVWHLGLMGHVSLPQLPPGAAGAAGAVPLPHAVSSLTSASSSASSALSSSPMMPSLSWMVLAHVIAGTLIGASLRYGERVHEWLVALAERPERLWDAVRHLVGSGRARDRAVRSRRQVTTDAALERLPMRRGPPRPQAA